MATVTLLEKVYGHYSARNFESMFKEMCKGLNVRLKILNCAPRGWIRIELWGEDEKVALKFLEKEMGLAPVHRGNVKQGDIIRGRIVASKSKLELHVDIGVYEPELTDAAIPLRHLQAQLADGKKLALQTIVELYGLYTNLPLEVKVWKPKADMETIRTELSENQISTFNNWLSQKLERLIILGATIEEVEYAVKKLRLSRDIYGIESLGLLEHAVICKLGTEAKGLIPKLGPKLPNAVLIPFSPVKIMKVTGRAEL